MKHVVAGILFFTMTGCSVREVRIDTYDTKLTQEKAFDRAMECITTGYDCSKAGAIVAYTQIVQHKDRDAGLIVVRGLETFNWWTAERIPEYALVIRTSKGKIRFKFVGWNVSSWPYDFMREEIMAYIKQDVSL